MAAHSDIAQELVDVAIRKADPRGRKAISLPGHDVFAAGLDQQSGAFASEDPGIPLRDFEGIEFVFRLDQLPKAFDQSLDPTESITETTAEQRVSADPATQLFPLVDEATVLLMLRSPAAGFRTVTE